MRVARELAGLPQRWPTEAVQPGADGPEAIIGGKLGRCAGGRRFAPKSDQKREGDMLSKKRREEAINNDGTRSWYG